MPLIIPNERSWDCPEGNFASTLINHHMEVGNDGVATKLRLVFLPIVPWIKHVTFYAGKDYPNPMHPDSEFIKDLKRWFGTEYLKSMVGQNLELEEHYGRPVEIKLSHKWNKKRHNKPFVQVGPLQAPGTLNLTWSPHQGASL